MTDFENVIFRPPSEAASLIIQVTYGCSWNKCTFCEMYTQKTFRIRSIVDIKKEIDSVAQYAFRVKKAFLADGNALVAKTELLLEVLAYLKEKIPSLRRISCYASASDIQRKSKEELDQLYKAGLSFLYIGIESGDNKVLNLINKGESYDSTLKACIKAQNSNMDLSVMIINGIGGKKYSVDHAKNSAKLINEIQPYYLSTLVLSYPFGLSHYQKRYPEEFEALSTIDLLKELRLFISELDLKASIYRSDHASNYLILKGVLGKDKQRLLNDLDNAISDPENTNLREEWMRGL